MKTIQEVDRWCVQGVEELGDPSLAVCQLFARYVGDGQQRLPKVTDYFELFCYREQNNELILWLGPELIIPLTVSRDGPEYGPNDRLIAFGAESITRGVWALTPSLNIPGVIHAFVILYDVPAPAPWERLIILPGEAA